MHASRRGTCCPFLPSFWGSVCPLLWPLLSWEARCILTCPKLALAVPITSQQLQASSGPAAASPGELKPPRCQPKPQAPLEQEDKGGGIHTEEIGFWHSHQGWGISPHRCLAQPMLGTADGYGGFPEQVRERRPSPSGHRAKTPPGTGRKKKIAQMGRHRNGKL